MYGMPARKPQIQRIQTVSMFVTGMTCQTMECLIIKAIARTDILSEKKKSMKTGEDSQLVQQSVLKVLEWSADLKLTKYIEYRAKLTIRNTCCLMAVPIPIFKYRQLAEVHANCHFFTLVTV